MRNYNKISIHVKLSIISIVLVLTIASLYIFTGGYNDYMYHVNALEDISSESYSNAEASAQKSKYYIHIDLDEKQLYLYCNGELLKKYPVSGGKYSTPSPIGQWTIISKDTWGDGFGGAWMGFNVPWGKYGIHGTVHPWDTGKYNASQGCIRMKNEDVRELYKMVPHGTPVTIVYPSIPFRQIKNGDIGSDVYNIQKKLKEKGYYKGYVSGKYTLETQQAVAKYQKEKKLYGNGIVNKKTYDSIMSSE